MTGRTTALLVGLLVVAAPVLAVAVGPADAQTVGITNSVEAVERTDDGRVVVLERVGQARRSDGDLAVVHVSEGMDGEAVHHRIDNTTIPATASVDLVGLVPARDEGWWLVAANGTAYRFGAAWSYAESTRRLPRPDDWPAVESYGGEPARWLTAAERGPEGGLWVAGHDGLVVYGSGFGEVRAAYPRVYDGDEYRAVGLEVARGAVWLLGHDGLRRYDLADGSTRLADQQPDDVDRFHDSMEGRTDVEPAPDRDWLVVDGGGTVHRVTGSLAHTGIGHEVGSDAAYPGTPSDILVLLPPLDLVLAALGALVLLGLWGSVLALGWHRDLDARGYAAAPAVCVPVLLAVYVAPWPLRPLLFTMPGPEVVVPLATLLGVAGHLGALRATEVDVESQVAAAVAYGPLVVAGVVLLVELAG